MFANSVLYYIGFVVGYSGRERDLIRLHYHLISREYMWLTTTGYYYTTTELRAASAEASFSVMPDC